MAKSRTYCCEDRKCAQTWVCTNLRRTQSHLPWEIPAWMWNHRQSHPPGYKPGLQIVLLTMTVILDLKEQRGRSFKTSSPSIQVKQDYRKNRQVCNLEQKLLLTAAPGAMEPVKSRADGHRDVAVPVREPSNPQKEASPVHYLVPKFPPPSACQTAWKTLSRFLVGWNAFYIAGVTKSFLESWCNQKF